MAKVLSDGFYSLMFIRINQEATLFNRLTGDSEAGGQKTTLGNSAHKSHAGLLNQSIKGRGPGTSIFTGTPARSQAP